MLAGVLLSTALHAAPQVATPDGELRGERIADVAVFRGIPYAAPPVGELRWRAPRPVARWTGVRDATHFGPACPQAPRPGSSVAPETSEDCLTLNVWTPALGASQRLPVMVWIHGGAYAFGSGRRWLDQGVPALVERGVVLVSINYRIGRLGFFAHPALAAAHRGEPTGNFWLMDQAAALRWVQHNIAAFGGDPQAVTIFGVSAGGSSVNALVASPRARGLFARAIAQSGGGLNNAATPLEVAEREARAFATRAGIDSDAPDAATRLRALTPQQVLAADPGPPAFGAIVDGEYLTETLAESFARGATAGVPYLAGTTSDEASVFGLMGLSPETLERRFGLDLAAVAGAYRHEGTPDVAFAAEVGSDYLFGAGAGALAGFVATHGQPAYVYRMEYVAEALRERVSGVPHGGEQHYLFGLDYVASPEQETAGTFVPAPTPRDRAVAASMQHYWAQFAKSGDPNGPGLPPWPHFDAAGGAVLAIDDPPRATAHFRGAQFDYWYRRWRTAAGRPAAR